MCQFFCCCEFTAQLGLLFLNFLHIQYCFTYTICTLLTAAGGCSCRCRLLIPLLRCSSPTAAAAVTAAAAAASCHVRCTTFLPLQAALTLLCCHGLRLAVSPQLLLLLPLLLLCRFVCRTIVCTAYLPSPGLEPAPAPLALANQHYPAK